MFQRHVVGIRHSILQLRDVRIMSVLQGIPQTLFHESWATPVHDSSRAIQLGRADLYAIALFIESVSQYYRLDNRLEGLTVKFLFLFIISTSRIFSSSLGASDSAMANQKYAFCSEIPTGGDLTEAFLE